MQGIKQFIDDHVEMIAVSAISLQNAKELSGKFLMAQALLTSFLKDFEDDKTKLMTMKEVNYATAIKVAEGKTITEKKVSVNLDVTYTSSREALEQIENIRDYIKTHMKIFENAHLMYRQYGRE
tara:strand:+ start:75773 stop:76144 length:372 start_codon:yes stop_codon:yes gene_type:complete